MRDEVREQHEPDKDNKSKYASQKGFSKKAHCGVNELREQTQYEKCGFWIEQVAEKAR